MGSRSTAQRPPPGGWRDVHALGLVALLWIVAILIVDPRGGFPVTDDWAFSQPVRTLVEEGRLRFSNWGAMNLMSQVLWGAPFAALFGTEPIVLRCSVLLLALIGGFAFYRLARLANLSATVASFATLLLLFNPIWLYLSFSFMTDVPFVAFQLVAMWLLAAGALRGSRVVAGAGWAAAIAALMVRQFGVALAIGHGAERIVRHRFAPRAWILALAPILLFLVVQWGYGWTLRATGLAPAYFGHQIGGLTTGLLSQGAVGLVSRVARNASNLLFYLGFFSLPLTLLAVPHWRGMLPPRWSRASLALAIGLAVLLALATVLAGRPFPMWEDSFRVNGVGPDLEGPGAPWAVVLASTLAASAGAVLLVAALAAAAVLAWRDRQSRPFSIAILAGATGLVLAGPVMLMESTFDRYLLPILPCVLLAVATLLREPLRPLPWILGGAAAAALGLYSVVAVHDFMAAKRVQWGVYQQAIRTVPTERIDAGWSLNGAYNYERHGPQGGSGPLNMEGWFASDDYRIRPGDMPEPGFELLAVHPVDRWTPWGRGSMPILVQRRRNRVTQP